MDTQRSTEAKTAASTNATDASLVERASEGHLPALTALMRRYDGRLYRIARTILRDMTDAEEACQETWLRAYGRLEHLREDPPFATWLARIGLRCALERVPRFGELTSLDELDRMPVAPLLADADAPARTGNAVEQAIDELVPSQRLVVILREVERMPIGVVAQVLGLAEADVRERLQRAHARLAERLGTGLGAAVDDVYRFDRLRCDRMVGLVVRRIYGDERYASKWALHPSS